MKKLVLTFLVFICSISTKANSEMSLQQIFRSGHAVQMTVSMSQGLTFFEGHSQAHLSESCKIILKDAPTKDSILKESRTVLFESGEIFYGQAVLLLSDSDRSVNGLSVDVYGVSKETPLSELSAYCPGVSLKVVPNTSLVEL